MYFTHTFGRVCAGDFSHGKVVIYICEIAASTGPIYVTKSEYGVLVE
jgi:hypothetical protein